MIAIAHEADLDEPRGVLGNADGGLELPLKVVRTAWSTHRSSSPPTVVVISFHAATARGWRKRRRRSLPEKAQPINRPPASRRSGGRVEQAVNYENCGDT